MAAISPEYWQRLESLFHAVVAMEEIECQEYLDRACEGEAELRRQVESLILSSHESRHIMDGLIAEEAASVTGLAPGDRIGQYEIVRELGQGGMGTVYLAVRADDQFRKQVAIKLMRADFLSRSTIERFRTERQILANLEHPGIARLIDGGATAVGSPYVVMEYVDGVPVDTYCVRNHLSVRERLALFLRIADAVSYAHRNLIVHRDIKPDNVLVTPQGDPKLLDFGIAKLLTVEASAFLPGQSPALTVASERLMTPEFASPEQARGETITTLSDVYSLGVLLYKLLTSKVPLRFTSNRAADIEREICEKAPVKPSLAARETGAWDKLSREAAHDLDTILLVALHKEPARRYASVEALSADLRRFLEGFPVLARGDSWSYRSRKLMRRHPLATAAAVLFLVLIVAFSAGMAVLARRARQQARAANEVTDYLLGVFRSNDPASGRGDLVTARELLDRGAKDLDRKLQDDPQLQARMLDTMGELYNDLGLSQRAEELLRRSLKVRASRLSMHDAAAADTLDRLGDVAQDLSRYAEAEQDFRQALAVRLKANGSQSSEVALDYARISSVMWNLGRFPQAEQLDRQAIALETKIHGADALSTLDIQNDLGTIFDDEGRYQEAADQAHYVLEQRLRIEPPNHPDLGYSWHNYAQPLASLGRFAEAEQAERQAVAVRIQAYGENHPQVAENQSELAGILVKTGKFEEALQLSKQALNRELQIYGSEGRDVNYCRQNYARALLAAGRGSEALEQMRTASAVWSKLVPPHHPKLAKSLQFEGTIDMALGNQRAAAEELGAAVDYLTDFFGPRHVLVADAQIERAEALTRLGETEQARRLATEALATERSTFPGGHPGIGLAESALAQVELAERHPSAAVPLLEDALSQVSRAYGPNHPQTAAVGMRLAGALALDGSRQAGLQLARAQAPILLASNDPRWRQERALAEQVERRGAAALLP